MELQDFRVSVIITSYNQKDYLVKAIESVIRQTVRVHEIIVADDHSTDDSVAAIQDYMERHPGWIKGIFHKANLGIPRNRNSALKEVTGTHVAILDGDDLFLPNKLELEFQALNQYPQAQCVYSNVRFINPDGKDMGLRDQQGQPGGYILTEIAQGKFGLLRSLLIQYDLLKDVGFFDERLPKYDGFDLTVRLANRTEFAYILEPTVEYRVHPSSDSTALKAQAHINDLEIIYQNMWNGWVNHLPSEKQEQIRTAWAKRLLRWQLFKAAEKRDFVSASGLALRALLRQTMKLDELLKLLKAVLLGKTYRTELLRKV